MDQTTSTERSGFRDMQGFHDLRRVLPMFTSRVPRGAIILTVLVASVVVFFSNRTPVALNHSNGFHGLPNPSRSLLERITSLSSPWNTRDLRRMPNPSQNRYWQLHGVTNSRSQAFSIRSHTGSTCGASVEDFVEDQRVATGDCNGGRLCRARMVVSKQGTDAIIQVGYNIFYNRGVIAVNSRTKQRVKAVTRAEANNWAKALLKKIGPSVEAVNCKVTVSMISDALMQSKNDAARCPRTDDPLCTQLKTVNSCKVFEYSSETEQEKECREFVESGVSISDFEDLEVKSPCAGVKGDANIVYMTVPLCTTTCAASACPHEERTIFANMSVRGSLLKKRYDGTDITKTQNSMASVYLAAYNTLIANNIPSCNNMPYGVLKGEFWEGKFFDFAVEYLVAYRTAHEEFPYIIPKHLQDIAGENYGGFIYDLRYELLELPADHIESQCSLVG